MSSAEGRSRHSRAWRQHLWRLASQVPGGVTLNCVLDGRLRMRVDSLDQSVSRAVYFNGIFEAAEIAYIRRIVRPGMNVVDVGANVGVHTLTLADCVGPRGIVHAFEPTKAFDRLRENVRLNGFESRSRLNQCAVGAWDGTIRLSRCKPGYEAYTSYGMPVRADYATGKSFEVPTRSLDLYAEEFGVRVLDFVKIDVEGFEPEILRGAARLLEARRIRSLMFEINETCLCNCGFSARQLITPLLAMGFQLRLLGRDGGLQRCPDNPVGNWTTVVGWL